MGLFKLIPDYLLATVVLILGLWALYKLLFGKEQKLSTISQKSLKEFLKNFKTIDKREQFKVHQQTQKYLDFYDRHGLMPSKMKSEINNNLVTAGIADTELFITNFLKDMPMIRLVLLVLIGINVVGTGLLYLMIHEFTPITTLLVLITICLLSFFLLAPRMLLSETRTKKKKFIDNLEKDYQKLFDHLYFYYAENKEVQLLSTVLGKRPGNIGEEMSLFITQLISDCKSGEAFAIREASLRYKDSQKIVNLMGKLSRCVTGSSLGSEELKSLYDQMIAEEDLKRELSEEKRNEIFIFIMLAGTIIMFGAQMVGLMLEMMKGVNLT